MADIIAQNEHKCDRLVSKIQDKTYTADDS